MYIQYHDKCVKIGLLIVFEIALWLRINIYIRELLRT